jgi:Cof subfamily protein (haloacid dehalogenase superfamily)
VPAGKAEPTATAAGTTGTTDSTGPAGSEENAQDPATTSTPAATSTPVSPGASATTGGGTSPRSGQPLPVERRPDRTRQRPQPNIQTFADTGTRLIATDLDGTLLRSDHTVSPRTVAALAAAERAGVEVFFVTGRPLRWMGVVAEHLAGHGLAILANGAGVYDLRAGTLIEAFPLPEADALAIARALRAAHPETTFAVERTGGFRREPAYPWFEPDHAGRPAPLDELLAGDRAQPVLKLLAHHPSAGPDEFLTRALALAGDRVEVTRSSPSALLEISGAGVSKATTLAKCCAERGITAAEVVAFGDMPNDLAMLSWAGTSYAVANAHPHVRAATTHGTASNDEDGVAQVIERIVAARTSS